MADPYRRRPSLVNVAAGIVFMIGIGAVSAAFLGPVVFPDAGSDRSPTPSATTVPVDAVAAQAAVDAFASALETGDFEAVAFADGVMSETVTDDVATATGGLGEFGLAVSPGSVAVVGDRLAQAPLQLTWTFPGAIAWTTATNVTVEDDDGTWAVRWTPAVLEPTLVAGDRLRRERIAPTRAEILGRDGSVLVSDLNVVRVGIRPSRVQDLPTLLADINAVLPIDADAVTAQVEAARPDEFVEIAVLPRARYESIRDRIFPLPGTVFEEQTRPTSGDPTLARALLGRSGEVTAEIIEDNPGLFVPGDFAGLSGLQEQYNPVLAGTPGTRISVLRTSIDPSSTTTGTGLTTTSALRDPTTPEVLAVVDPTPGAQVVTTIDPVVQAAAEAALDLRPETTALVAVEVSTGDVVAVANGPRGVSVNNALAGRYPPGSIFKVVSGYALLRDRLEPEGPIDCPGAVTVTGRTFRNAGTLDLGTIPFRTAFALSCNTAFINGTVGYGPDVLAAAGTDFGLGVEAPIGVPAFTGAVPMTDDEVALAATAFGQGETLMSPLSAAVMAATAADGVYRSPRLITAPNPGAQVVTQLDPDAARALRQVMRAVVTEGTGGVVSAVPGPPVSAKTGTAEFGNQVPPQAHAWIAGYQGNLAFAVFVEGGESGGGVAGPVAARFLEIVADRPDPTAPSADPSDTPDTTSPDGDPPPTSVPSTTAPSTTTTTTATTTTTEPAGEDG